MEKTATRITKAMRYEDIKALLNGTAVSHGTTVNDAIEFINGEMDLLKKKNAKKSTTPSKQQIHNMGIKEKILAVVQNSSSENGITSKEIAEADSELAEESTARIAALCHALAVEGKISSKQVKGKNYYTAC